MNRALTNRPVNVDLGILILRLGVGSTMLLFHGWSKLTGGTEMWASVGGAMGPFSIGLPAVFWGFLAAFAESIGSAMLVVGVLFRPMTLMLAFTMFVAAMVHVNMPAENPNSGWSGASHALLYLSAYVGLFFAGAGRFAVTLRRAEK